MHLTDRALIDRYIDTETDDRGPAYARLADYGPHVWALIGYYLAVKDVARVAAEYDISPAAMNAALAYYRHYQRYIDALLLLNDARPDEAAPTATLDQGEAPPRTTIEETILEGVRALPPERQQEVLDFVEFLKHRATRKRPLKSVKGLWADLGVAISEADIAEARREIWGNFPREFPIDSPEGA